MAQLKRSQVKAATLLEVIVAMVIIMIVFVIATAIYTNVIGSSPSLKQQQGRAVAAAVIKQSIAEQNWKDETVMLDSIVLQKSVVQYKTYDDLVMVTVVASEHGKEIGRSRQVVKKIEDEAE
ncbi:PulJ/GspJ family protein [Pedobacter frigoris]|uniref:Uncharacterized protein n=1 Tax=Pedobacter frigoris TaxID=2571272 RepID=A0A4U1CNK6_9SPHI|nr:prepilin-type N-terminal cleavage/methylation domain-containing protein [Pedobacter frigoris]TKC09084.1 hypothetical protein FA047_03030 [Pedobacter frigoris]